MAMNNPYQQYQQNSIFTARPEELTLMLYEGCIKFINKAIFMCEKRDIQGTNESLKRAQEIIEELDRSLDDQYEISKNLHLLYDYSNRRLVEANIQKDVSIMREVVDLISDLKNTWKEAMVISKKSS